MDGTLNQLASQSTLIDPEDSNANKTGVNIVTFSDCWTSKQCHTKDSNAPIHQLTQVEKLAALVLLLRSHWNTAEHYCLEYLERITIIDPQLYFVALREGAPVGTRLNP